MSGKTDLEQALADHIKIARAAIRLKHSIAADNELNYFLPLIRLKLEAQMQRGELPALSAPDIFYLANEMEGASRVADSQD